MGQTLGMTVDVARRMIAANSKKPFIVIGGFTIKIIRLLKQVYDFKFIVIFYLLFCIECCITFVTYKTQKIKSHLICQQFINQLVCKRHLQKINQKMQIQSGRPSLQVTATIAKIDQILRLYQMSKKSDPSKKNVVQKKVNDLIGSIKGDLIYSKIQEFLNKKVQTALQDSKVPLKVQKQASNMSSIRSVSNPSQQKVLVSEASISNNNNISSVQKSNQKVQSRPSIQTVSINKQSNSSSSVQSPSIESIQNSSEMSNDKSQDNSFVMLLDNLLSICHQFSNRSQELLSFNEDIFSTVRQNEDKSMIYLFGVNNPEKKNIKKLYICTLMKFSTYEVMNSLDHNGQNKFQKEAKMFENNLRSPMGLIICGKSIEDISIEHVRFLADMKSPLGIVMLMESFQEKKGLVFQFSAQTLRASRDLNKVQYEQKTMELRKQYAPKGKDLAKLEVVKDKLVITKNLPRSITQSIQPAYNAIQIESANECIKQQPNRFPYKLHSKYYVSPKSDYQLFFLDNQLIAFKMNYKEKEFENFKKFVLEEAHQKGNYLMSTSVLKENSEIKKDFWRLLVQCKTRDDYFLVNLSGITIKKTIILSLRQGVTEDIVINAEPFLFKDLQKSTDIINVVAIITKQNYKQFQSQSKVEVIDLTQKKK